MVRLKGYRTAKRFWVWVRRMKYSRGFGVQSPWAYSFIRYVVNEHYPYYAYDDLGAKYPHVPKDHLKLARLYFRISNHMRAAHWYFLSEPSGLFRDYILAGSRDAQLSVVDVGRLPTLSSGRSVAVVPAGLCPEPIVRWLGGAGVGERMAIIEGIHQNRAALRWWGAVREDPLTGVTFDLYSCGIVFFDHSRFKQHYKVNF